ncbi:MAG: DUF305 domain-containing protein [Gemmatimonadales bacterium]
MKRFAALLVPCILTCGGAARALAQAPTDTVRAALRYTAADVDFMSGMIAHHAQAVAMARWAPSHGASPTVRTLCERIINAQTDEIALMQRWLGDRRQPVPAADPRGMHMAGMDQPMLMPGMLTGEQMTQLDASRGPDFDQLFLRFMIQHHRGAVSMVNDLFGKGAGEEETVYKFASDVYADQTTEIARMQRMLGTLLFGVPGQ